MNTYDFDKIKYCIISNKLLSPLDVLLVGGTGTGKSSTLNALFGYTVAEVGNGVAPQTKQITSYPLHGYLRFHDSAGLGDGKAPDSEHSKNITAELQKECNVNGTYYAFIDLVVVLIDGSSRDMGTTFRLLENVVLKVIEPQRVIVAINQADLAMKGRYWNVAEGRPESPLIDFLEEKSLSIQQRIKDSTGLTIAKPVYYSAQYGYNVDAFIDHIVEHIPRTRRTISMGAYSSAITS